MKLLVLGAKLQGMEAIYLGKKAGYYVIVADKNPQVPGVCLADEFAEVDIMNEDEFLPYIKGADIILPAIEDAEVLEQVKKYGEMLDKQILFDFYAYAISSSKQASNQLFEELNLPMPEKYPDCGYPVIIKPDGLSGSSHVSKAYTKEDVESYMRNHEQRKLVIQEYLEGASYSIEVIGDGKNFFYPQITEVIVDDAYDCKKIVAPAAIGSKQRKQMLQIAETIAKKLKIHGIFDIEVIEDNRDNEDNGKLKLLEIDARLPSQTPISVYHSTGINMVELMVDLLSGKVIKSKRNKQEKCCLYQQIQVQNQEVQVLGEHIMGSCSHLRLLKNLFGADEVITDYTEGSKDWKAIVIITRDTREEAENVFSDFVQNVKQDLGIVQWRKVG